MSGIRVTLQFYVSFVAIPFMIGSLYALICTAAVFIIMFTRTALEDKTLQRLPGYQLCQGEIQTFLVYGKIVARAGYDNNPTFSETKLGGRKRLPIKSLISLKLTPLNLELEDNDVKSLWYEKTSKNIL